VSVGVRRGQPKLARVIWESSANPTDYVSEQLGIERWELREAIHKIKASSDLGGANRVIIYDDGSVTDENGELIGNIHDEL
jgi:hypothetical protein